MTIENTIERVDIDSLSPDRHNARLHDEGNLAAIRSSLSRFGQQKPIVVDQQGVILAGNGTWRAARSLGWRQILIARTTLDRHEAAAFALADNRTAELARWDHNQLARTLDELSATRDERLQQATGFDEHRIEQILDQAGLRDPLQPPLPEVYQLVIDCSNEAEQAALFETLAAMNVRARVVSI